MPMDSSGQEGMLPRSRDRLPMAPLPSQLSVALTTVINPLLQVAFVKSHLYRIYFHWLAMYANTGLSDSTMAQQHLFCIQQCNLTNRKYLRKWDNCIRMVFDTDRSCNCAFEGSGEFWGILTISTARKALIIFDDRVCRVFTNGPTALIIAIANIGSLKLAAVWLRIIHWFLNETRKHSV